MGHGESLEIKSKKGSGATHLPFCLLLKISPMYFIEVYTVVGGLLSVVYTDVVAFYHTEEKIQRNSKGKNKDIPKEKLKGIPKKCL